jgi:glycosyltransferase involved in cell wall biosynthesis
MATTHLADSLCASTDLRDERHTIVCLSSQPWADRMWTNKQHVMSRLALRHRVLFVNPEPTRLSRLAECRSVARLLSDGLDWLRAPLVERVNGVEVLDFWGPVALMRSRTSHPLRIAAEFDLKTHLLKRYLEKDGITQAILWVYHPGYGARLAELPRKLLVYDCVDEYSEFPVYKSDPGWIIQREAELCGAADLVFTTSPRLQETKAPLNPSHTHLVPNVGDAAHFARAFAPETSVPEDLRELPRPIACFIGAVSSYKLEADWLVVLAKARPDISVVVIGPIGLSDPDTNVDNLRRIPNLHLLGYRAYAELPGYLKGSDVAIIPYRRNGYTERVFPIKFFEMLATGLPVVISDLPALEPHYGLVRVATTADEFVARCVEALNEDTPEQRSKRIAVANANSWPVRVGRLMELIEERLS